MCCEGFSIRFSEVNIQNIRVACPKAVILYGGSPLKTAVTRVRAVKVTFYFHENLTFKLTKNRRVNIQKTYRLKTNRKVKYMAGKINKANMKMLAERERERQREREREICY